jgi:hypothetical protein
MQAGRDKIKMEAVPEFLKPICCEVELSDVQLIHKYLVGPEAVAREAFAALVDRHGSLVLRTCRGILEILHDAQDAYQATFLILARNAKSIRDGTLLGRWLCGVARLTAMRRRADVNGSPRHGSRECEANDRRTDQPIRGHRDLPPSSWQHPVKQGRDEFGIARTPRRGGSSGVGTRGDGLWRLDRVVCPI